MKIVWTYLRHLPAVLLVSAGIALGAGLWFGADVDFGDNMTAYKVGDEGPHIFQRNGRWVQQTLRGNRDEQAKAIRRGA